MSQADRAELAFCRALRLAGRLVTLRRKTAAQGAYDPSTGTVPAGTPESITVAAIMLTNTTKDANGALRFTKVALLPGRMVEKHFGVFPWGDLPWTGELPMLPKVGDEIVDASGAFQVLDPSTIEVQGRVITHRLVLGAGA